MSNPDLTFHDNPVPLIEGWDDGLAQGSTYHFDVMHFPYPLSPLTLDVFASAWSDGATRGLREFGVPLRRWHVIGRNHYRFDWQEMAGAIDGAAIEATMHEEVSRLLARWKDDHLPVIQTDLHRLEQLTVEVATASNVPGLIDQALTAYADLWRVHFLVVTPMSTAMQIYDDFYVDVFGGSLEDGHPLLAGQLNESVKASLGLSDLAVQARDLGIAATILDHEVPVALNLLATTEAGQAFLADLDTYLTSYGLRQDLFDLASPTWRERPAYALTNVRNYLRTGLDARMHHAEIQAAAEMACEQARTILTNYPQPVGEQFEALLAMAQAGSFLQEEHNYYIDQLGGAWLRLFFLAVSERLVANGSIETPDDVFFLSTDQIRMALDTPTPLQERLLAQRQELELAQSIVPPPFIGIPPSGPPPADSPFDRSIIRFFGAMTPESDDPDRVLGNPGARGTAIGPARVVRTLEEASALQPGEILITVTTMPPWSPLFAVAAGVVTETGGPLSHCAIVAREYEIPAVVGARHALQRIATGQMIAIDGSTGIVDLHV